MEIKRMIDELGRLVIPAELRERYGVEVGSTVYLCPFDDGILLRSESCGEGAREKND